MELTLETAYWEDRGARDAFKDFLLEIHGLDLSRWESAGYWDDAYTPFSFFEGGTVVASVCVYLLDAVLEGRATRLAQVSGVGTLPRWRRRGLNRRLTEIGLEWARGKHDGVFLFADTDATPFYEKCGFRPQVEYVESFEVRPPSPRGRAVKLDAKEERTLARIHDRAERRAPVSERLGVLNAKLVMFHVLYGLRDVVYEIPDLDCLVFFSRKAGRLGIFDIVGERIPAWKELYPYIAEPGDRVVELHFHSDKLALDAPPVTRPVTGNHCFVREPFPLGRPVFPHTCRA